jgi:O6-methylguanine-DNA--protein-cysteine methyltransferase
LIVVPCHRVIGTDGSSPVVQEVYGVKNGLEHENQQINKVYF